MRMKPAADDLLERAAISLNLAPMPGAYAMYGMVVGRIIGVAKRLGIFDALVAGSATSAELAERLSLQGAGTRLLCENLVGVDILDQRGDTFSLTSRARKWLDPASESYIGTWIEHTASYWEWYGDLERIVRDGGSFEIHREPADEQEYWRVYITGQYELARLSAQEVAKAIRLPSGATHLLDVAGAHGWFAAAVCARHAGLTATVLDLPGSARVGREIMAAAGLSDTVTHVDGDMFESELGGPYDGTLLFDIVHHLTTERIAAVLSRIRAAMKPGATIAILDMFRGPPGRQHASAAAGGLFFHLTSGADLPDPAELARLLERSGFDKPRRTKIRRIPDQDLYQATAV